MSYISTITTSAIIEPIRLSQTSFRCSWATNTPKVTTTTQHYHTINSYTLVITPYTPNINLSPNARVTMQYTVHRTGKYLILLVILQYHCILDYHYHYHPLDSSETLVPLPTSPNITPITSSHSPSSSLHTHFIPKYFIAIHNQSQHTTGLLASKYR